MAVGSGGSIPDASHRNLPWHYVDLLIEGAVAWVGLAAGETEAEALVNAMRRFVR